MKRGGGADLFLRSIEKMRRVIPGAALRTSFIVGFPGETEREFEELCDFVKEAAFDWMGAFGYSDQEGAGAYDQEKKLSPREIESRRKALMSIQKKISRAKKKSLVGREFDLLLEGASTESDLLLEGRTPRETIRKKESSTAAGSRRRTTMIWWRRSFKVRGQR
jgi:ribosomal protein S12 methylthiotransferase